LVDGFAALGAGAVVVAGLTSLPSLAALAALTAGLAAGAVWLAFAVLAGAAVLFAVELTGAAVLFADVTLTAAGVALVLALLAVPFAGVSVPLQATPRAPRPRTAESTITFFILFDSLSLSIFLKVKFPLICGMRPIVHGLCHELFLSQGKRENRN